MNKIVLYLASLFFIFASCESKDDDKSSDNNITSFKFSEVEATSIEIKENTIDILLPNSADLSNLTPIIEVAPGAVINPASDVKQDFSKAVVYTVTAENGDAKQYTVSVLTERAFLVKSISLFEIYIDGTIEGDKVKFEVPFGTDISALKVSYDLFDNNLTSNITNNGVVNFTDTKEWILSKGGVSKKYAIEISVQPQETGIRAVWVTNVASEVLFSEAKLDAMVNRLADLKFNTICVVAYNKSQTIFPSQTLADVLGTTAAQTVISGCSWGDVLGKLIEKAHAKNMKVIAWFEYGFASHYAGQSSPIYDKKPEWISRDINGNPTEKNSFYWLNGFHQEVQQFLTDMIVECVHKYPQLDGVQGDDRLPALPSHGGYDTYTKNLYKTETGRDLPTDPKETNFFNWKSKKMTDFAVKLYKAVKVERSTCLVTWAPSTRGWANDNYLQDWPEWLKQGAADYISPQLYRQESQGLGAYTSLVYNDLATVFTTPELRKKYVPGMLVRNGDQIVTDRFLVEMIQYNRSKGVNNEACWFYEATPSKTNAYKAIYSGVAIFPSF